MGSRTLDLLLLLLLLSFQNHMIPSYADARPLPFLDQEKYVKVLTSLGMMCQCCDGAGGECRSTWNSTCGELRCRPWKFL